LENIKTWWLRLKASRLLPVMEIISAGRIKSLSGCAKKKDLSVQVEGKIKCGGAK
jgi:hypothetical protein